MIAAIRGLNRAALDHPVEPDDADDKVKGQLRDKRSTSNLFASISCHLNRLSIMEYALNIEIFVLSSSFSILRCRRTAGRARSRTNSWHLRPGHQF